MGSFCSLPGVRAQRMTLGNLDEDERDAVGIGDVHLVQTPRFAPRLARDRHAAAAQFGLGGFQVAHLQPQRAGKRSAGMVRLPETGQFQQ